MLQYDPNTGAVIGSTPLASDNYVGMTAIGSDLFVVNISGNVYQINPITGTRTFLFNASTNENMGRYGSNLIFNNWSSGAFSERTTTGGIVRTGSLAAGATGLEGYKAGNRIYAGQYSGSNAGDVRIYDGTSLAFLGNVGIGLPSGSVSAMSYDPGLDQFWVVTGFGDNQIRKYDSSGILLDNFATGSNWVNAFTVLPSMIEVSIDIKFCSDPNAFNCRKKGVLPVTIFGTDSFDVADINTDTLKLCLADLSECTNGPRDYSIADRGDPTVDLGANQCAIDPTTGQELDFTLNQDGWLDLDAAFEASDVQALLGDFCANGAKGDVSVALVIIGETWSGVPIHSVPQNDNTGIDRLVKVNK